MATLHRWIAPVVLALGLGAVAAVAPTPARAGDDLVRVLVDVADVIYHGGRPYYRYGDYGYRDRVVVVRERGYPRYYRYVPRHVYHAGPPYGRAHGYWRKHGHPAYYVRDRDDNRYWRGYRDGRRDDRYDRRWDDRRDRRWRDDD